MSLSLLQPSTSLPVALAHTISFLTRSLILRYPAPTTIGLQRALEGTLLPYYSASWVPSDPSRGSGRRCLTLTPGCIPPRPIFAACEAAGVQWEAWMDALGGHEFDLFVDPGRVAVRFAESRRTLVVWTADPREGDEYAPGALIDATQDGSVPRTPTSAAQEKAEAGAALRAKMLQGAKARALRNLSEDHGTFTLPALVHGHLYPMSAPAHRLTFDIPMSAPVHRLTFGFGHQRSESISSDGSEPSSFYPDDSSSETDITSAASGSPPRSPPGKQGVRFALPAVIARPIRTLTPPPVSRIVGTPPSSARAAKFPASAFSLAPAPSARVVVLPPTPISPPGSARTSCFPPPLSSPALSAAVPSIERPPVPFPPPSSCTLAPPPRITRTVPCSPELLVPPPRSTKTAPSSPALLQPPPRTSRAAPAPLPLPPRVNKAIPIVAPPANSPKPQLDLAAQEAQGTAPYKMSRRERARQRRAGIVLDTQTPVTPFHGGRTTVLGGGVLLGGARAIRAS